MCISASSVSNTIQSSRLNTQACRMSPGKFQRKVSSRPQPSRRSSPIASSPSLSPRSSVISDPYMDAETLPAAPRALRKVLELPCAAKLENAPDGPPESSGTTKVEVVPPWRLQRGGPPASSSLPNSDPPPLGPARPSKRKVPTDAMPLPRVSQLFRKGSPKRCRLLDFMVDKDC